LFFKQEPKLLLKKALRNPHHLPHYVYWKTKPLLKQSYFTLKLGVKTFKFQGQDYHYFCHPYNTAWKNERAVEIPIVWEIVKNCHGKILEVGNVLSHYHHVTHNVVDKYEKAKGVINQDVVDFRPTERYDLIVSISTLEHIGVDENPKEPKKVLRAIENLKSNCLALGGTMIITAPLGHNPEFDKSLKQGNNDLGKQHYLKRLTKENLWTETGLADVQDAKYDFPFPNANAIVISIKNPSR
jgi:hypothetical protein